MQWSTIDSDVLCIDDKIISKLKLELSTLSIIQDDIDKYNKKLEELDYKKPVSLVIFYLHQGFKFYVREDDYWFQEQGYKFPEFIVMQLLNEYFDEILEAKINTKDHIKKGRNELRQLIIVDEEFHKCTNQALRRAYAKRMFLNNEEYQKLFYERTVGLYDITINSFMEELWREYKYKSSQITTL